uniref:Uncharacterized protein n=1 Tax=Arundo donax TaxID=35708 RepID=A0A0A9H692_ARUDO
MRKAQRHPAAGQVGRRTQSVSLAHRLRLEPASGHDNVVGIVDCSSRVRSERGATTEEKRKQQWNDRNHCCTCTWARN